MIKSVLQKFLICNESIYSHVINMNKCNCWFHGVPKNVPCDKLEEFKDFWPDTQLLLNFWQLLCFFPKWVIWKVLNKVLFANKVLYLKRLIDSFLQEAWYLGKRIVTSALGLWAMPLNETLNGWRTHWHQPQYFHIHSFYMIFKQMPIFYQGPKCKVWKPPWALMQGGQTLFEH